VLRPLYRTTHPGHYEREEIFGPLDPTLTRDTVLARLEGWADGGIERF